MKPANKTLAAIFALLAIMLFAACSSDSDSDDDFAGTTWTCSGMDEEGNTHTMTISFQSGGQVAMTMDGQDYETGTYSVSEDGSTVTISANGSEVMVLTYSSGKLEGSMDGDAMTFTKS